MPETLFDPTIHQSMEPLQGYMFDNKALVAQLNYLKEHPLPEMVEWMQAHPEFKGWNCAAFAAYSGLSEPTLKKLKGGQIADPRGSTYWILYNKFKILPRVVLKCIPEGICNIDCANQAQLRLKETARQMEEYDQRHAADQAELSKLRRALLDESKAAAAAQAHVDSVNAQILRRDKGIHMRNRLIFILIAVLIALFLADIFIANAGWLRFSLLK